MDQIGKVINVHGTIAVVQIRRHEACVKCGACGGASMRAATVEASNDIGAVVGQLVKLEIEAREVLGAAFIVYILPLAFMFAGFAVGMVLARAVGLSGSREAVAAVTGVIFLALSFAVIHYIDKKMGRMKLIARITQVVE